MRRRIRRKRRRLFFLPLSILFAWFVGEMYVYILGYDWQAVQRMLGYQEADRGSHEVVDDPEARYRLKPGKIDYPEYTVTINQLRFRDPPRSVEKPEGVFRIICLGGSNVYGLGLNDGETWPAQLEKHLNQTQVGRFEVWNGGACAYVPSQMIAVGREAQKLYDPDMFILSLSNGGGGCFMSQAPVRPFFRKYKQFYKDLFPLRCLDKPEWVAWDERILMVRLSPIARLFAANYTQHKDDCLWWNNSELENKNIHLSRAFIRENKKRGVPVVVFLYPGATAMIGTYRAYFSGMRTPVLRLRGDGLPASYSDVHPSANVTPWYAEKITGFLEKKKLLPK